MSTERSPAVPPPSSGDQTGFLPGVILLGGAHNALALARSFGRKNIPVALVTNDHPLPKFSRYVSKRFIWSGPSSASDWLITLAEQNDLKNWLLIPCGDGEVRYIAENRESLSRVFHVISCYWAPLSHLCDKQLLAQQADKLGIPYPKSYEINSPDEIAKIDIAFPVILKPAMRLRQNALTSAKAWQANSREELIAQYRSAITLQAQDGVVVQELIPGGGETQFSYAALWHNNTPLAEMVARRTRQYPVEIGFTSTFVEVLENEDIMASSRKLLSSMGFEGLVEVEYKLDTRSGQFKILDVNPRPWSWVSLADSSGLDFASVFESIISNKPLAYRHAGHGGAWVHLPRDIVACLILIGRKNLSIRDWLKSYRNRLTFAVFAWDDPLPGLLELPVSLWRALKRALK